MIKVMENINIQQLTERIPQVEFYRHLQKYVDRLVIYDDLDASRRLLLALNAVLTDKAIPKTLGLELNESYLNLKNILCAIILPALSDVEVVAYFKQGIKVALFISDIDFINKLEGKLSSIIIADERDNLKAQLRESLLNNYEIITTSNYIENKNKTIADWLNDYIFNVGTADTNLLKKEQYFSREKKYNSLNILEKKAVRLLFNIFDSLKLSSLTPKGNENIMSFFENGKWLVLDHGEVREIKENSPILKDILNLKKTATSQNKLSLERVGENLRLIKSSPTALKTPDPAFFFDLEDEEEVDQFRIKNQELGIGKTLEENLRLLAEEVIAEHNFQFKEAVSRRRFVQMFVSFMKDVRDVMEVKEVLLKNTTTGGLGLTSDKVEIVLGILRELRAQLPERMKDWEKARPESRIEKLESRKTAIITPATVTKPAPKPVPAVMPNIKADADQLAEWRQDLLAEIAETSVVLKPKFVVPKPKLVDVAAPPRTLGPIEELKTMKIGDFRRLGKTAVDVVDKIQSKIKLISETGIGRHMQAIKAWRSSPVYQMYIAIGGASIEQAKSVEDIIAIRQSAGQETLTLSEFEAIVDLNQKLRF